MYRITIGESVDVMTLLHPANIFPVIGWFRKVNHHLST